MKVRSVLSIAVCAAAFSASITGVAQAQFGANYGLAPAQGAAFPGDKAFWVGACDLEAASTSNGGVGTAPARPVHCIDTGAAQPCDLSPSSPVHCGLGDPRWGRTWMFGQEPSWRLDPFAQAAGHPDASTTFWLKRTPEPNPIWGTPQPDGDTKTVIVKLPPGVVGNPNAVPLCTSEHLAVTPNTCPPETQVGVSSITVGQIDGVKTTLHPVYNVEPRDGKTAEFLFSPQPAGGQGANIPIVAKARTGADFGVDAVAMNIPGGVPLLGQTLTVWGVPWAASHDIYRPIAGYLGSPGDAGGGMPPTGLPGGSPEQEPQSYSPDWGPIKPFFSNPTECAPTPPSTLIELDTWQAPNVLHRTSAPADTTVEGCAAVPFDSGFGVAATTNAADAPTGLSADLTVAQNDDPPPAVADDPDDDTGAPAHWKSAAGLAASQLDKTVVTLPDGFTVNPSGASGLEGCSDAGIGLIADGNPPLFTEDDPFDGQGAECPAGSKIGTAEVFTPLLPGAQEGTPNLTGDVVLGMPRSTNPESGQMFRLFVVMRNVQRGLVAKIHGTAVASRQTGQLTATFDKNPRVPFEVLHLEMKGGQRGLLATPPRCASRNWSALLTPWTAAHGGGGQVDDFGGAFVTNARCAYGFTPSLTTGMDARQGGGSGTFSFRFGREDGEQYFHSLSAELPQGLLASVRDVPLCTNAQAAAAACPAASRIGVADAGAGAGLPYFLEKKGTVYLTEGYKGAPYGLAVIVPVEAGPFTGQFALDTIVVRQALEVDPDDASVTAVSDPLPQIWHGIPLRVRQVTVKVDRPGFMRNPTDCSPKQIRASIVSIAGVTANVSRPFQASACRRLGFRPKLALRLIGKRQRTTGKHPRLKAVVTQGARSKANISRAEVRLPRSLALDPRNTTDPKMLCSYEGGLAGNCPKSTIIGRASAVSPLLKRRLAGPVHLVQGIRFSPGGNRIRTLPTLLVKLSGEVTLNLRGVSDVKRGRLVSIFRDVPDAQVSRFTMSINGGRKGILVVTATRSGRIDLCRSRLVAEADMDAHNGRRFDRDVAMKAPCRKAKKKRRG
jgi:hypothetical protein